MRLPILLFLCATAAWTAELVLTRPVRPWEFADAVGPRAAFLGAEQGTFDTYVYPLKIVRDLRLSFVSQERELPGSSLARRIVVRPGSYSIEYAGDDFRVTQTLVVPREAAGGLMLLDVQSKSPLRIDLHFTRDFQLMWPAAIGSAYGEWVPGDHIYRFGADGQPYAAVLGSPDASLRSREYGTNYSSDNEVVLTLGTVEGHGIRTIAFAGSVKNQAEALAAYRILLAQAPQAAATAEREYTDYLVRTVSLRLPDAELQAAYDWAKLSVLKGLVRNPLLGEGLVAGYGPSRGVYRPGFAWFFGRDSFWTSFALTAAGDFRTSKTALEFIATYQRADGKIPHEISQSASLLPWFENFPYGYNAADATPLFITAVRDYVQASGDVEFARAQAARIWKAREFMLAHREAAGFPQNIDIGPGWIEGGPLLPVRVEFYQAGCYVESLRSLAWLARLLQDSRAAEIEKEFQERREALDRVFWRPQLHAYAFALDPQGQPVDEVSVLGTVPMWFDVVDRRHAQEMIAALSEEQHAADWGMRIISSRSKLYDPSGYHFGSVWPLFTGWAAVGEYREHAAASALANLEANAALALDGPAGNVTEVLSGDNATSLSTASPHQTWSAAMVVSPILRGLFGLESDAVHHALTLAPHLPADWPSAAIDGLAGGTLTLEMQRDLNGLTLIARNRGSEPVTVRFAPAYPPSAKLTRASVDGQPVTWKTSTAESTDWHPQFTITAKPRGTTTLAVQHTGLFGYTIPTRPPQLAEASHNLKLVRERWSDQNRTVTLELSGRAGAEYRIALLNGAMVERVEGAQRAGADALLVRFAADGAEGYRPQTVTLHLR